MMIVGASARLDLIAAVACNYLSYHGQVQATAANNYENFVAGRRDNVKQVRSNTYIDPEVAVYDKPVWSGHSNSAAMPCPTPIHIAASP